MNRVLAVAATVALTAALAACGTTPATDDDTCVPPTPSPTGAAWTEQDDGEACAQDEDGTWTEADDLDLHDSVHRKPTKATRTTSTRTTRSARSAGAPKPAPKPVPRPARRTR